MQVKPTQKRLKEVLSYDPESGLFRWNVRRSGVRFQSVAGSKQKLGYIYINLDGAKYGAHRLAVLYMTGKFPDEDVDHINCDRADNRWCNLRAVTRRVNNQNRRVLRRDNATGFQGVSQTSDGLKWRARVMVDGKEVHVGRFMTKEQASEAYVIAKRKLHEGCTL